MTAPIVASRPKVRTRGPSRNSPTSAAAVSSASPQKKASPPANSNATMRITGDIATPRRGPSPRRPQSRREADADLSGRVGLGVGWHWRLVRQWHPRQIPLRAAQNNLAIGGRQIEPPMRTEPLDLDVT